MEQKKPGIPLVALIIFFVLIIGIIVTCLIIISTKPSDGEPQRKLYGNNTNETENAVVNNIEEPPADPSEEDGTEVNLNDSSVINAYKLAGNYNVPAKYAIYQNGDFSTDNINEILKLKIAFAQLSEEELNAGSITKARVEECLTLVFGSSEGVNMQTVTMFDDYNFKPGYDISSFDYDAQTETFNVRRQGIQNDDPCLVTEIVNKAISYTDKLEIYVTPMYIKTTDATIDGDNVKVYTLTSSYDFQNQTFTDDLISIRKEDYYNSIISGDTLDIDRYNYDLLSTTIKTNRQDQLDIATLQQYKYTFTKNGENYILSSFEKVVVGDESSDENNNENNNNNSNEQNPEATEENANGVEESSTSNNETSGN